MTRTLARIARPAQRALVAGVLVACHFTRPALAQGTAGDIRRPDMQRSGIQQPDVERAEGHAARAYQAYVRKDYAMAVRLYLRAYQAAPAPDILYNIARIYELGLRDRPLAIQFYREFMSEPNADPARIEFVAARLKLLEEEETRPPIAPSQLPPVPAPEAPHEARLSLSGVQTDRDTATEGWSPLRTAALVTAGAGLAAISAGAIFGLDALSEAKVVHDLCDGDVCASARGVSAVDAASKSADLATLGFALGGVLVATSATLLWIDLDTPHDPPSPPLSWSPVATDSELGVAVSGRW